MNPVEQGYDDQRFQNVVDDNFHCPICLNVLKEPVQCRRNEHYYCTPCITRHLKETSQTCPVCMDVLTVKTLKEPSRMVTSCLSPLKINCDFASRGCCQVVELGLLKTHVKNCEFSPVVACSIDGCLMMVNKRDVQHHETQDCEFRKLKCDDCGEEMQYMKYKTHGCVLSKEMDKMKMNQAEMKDQLGAQENKMKDQLGAQENMMKEMRGMMDEMKDEIKKLTKQVTVGLPREDIIMAGSFFEGQRPPMFRPPAVAPARFPSHNFLGQPGYPQMQSMNCARMQRFNTRPMSHNQQQSWVAGAGMTMPSQGVSIVQSRRNKHRRAPVNQPGAGPQAAANTSSSPQYYYGEGQDILNPTALAQASAPGQKQMLGERLFPLILQTHPDLAGKITGMLLEIDNSELLHMLEFRDALSAKVEEAVSVIYVHQAREASQEAAKK